MQENKPICLIKKPKKASLPKSHSKSKPTVLYKYKVQKPKKKHLTLPASAQKYISFDIDSMPKTLRAYYKASNTKNNIKTDRVAGQQVESSK